MKCYICLIFVCFISSGLGKPRPNTRAAEAPIPEAAKPDLDDDKWLDYVLDLHKKQFKLELKLLSEAPRIKENKPNAVSDVLMKLQNDVEKEDEKVVAEVDGKKVPQGPIIKDDGMKFENDLIAKIIEANKKWTEAAAVRFKNEAKIRAKLGKKA